jgi:hypothetical protein
VCVCVCVCVCVRRKSGMKTRREASRSIDVPLLCFPRRAPRANHLLGATDTRHTHTMILSFTLRTLLWANPAGRAGAALLSASTAAVAGARPTGACPAAVRALSSSSSAWPAAPPSEAREGPPRAGSGAAASTSGAYGRPMRGYAAAAAAAAAQPAPDDLLAPGGDGAAGAARAPPPPPPPLTQLPDVPPGSRRTGLVGVKAGMTHEWDTATGARTALTVVWFDAPAVLQAKAAAGPDGYEALQVGAGAARRRRASLRGVGRPAGHAAAHGGSVEAPPRWVKEFRVTPDAALPPGTRLRADHFAVGQLVDVQGKH